MSPWTETEKNLELLKINMLHVYKSGTRGEITRAMKCNTEASNKCSKF